MRKNAKQIKECIKKLKLLKTGIPHFSIFGDNNWGEIDVEIAVLERFLKEPDYDKLEDRLSDRLDEIDDEGGDCFEDSHIKAYDWILGSTDDELVSDGDIEIFCKKKKKNKKS